MKFQLSIVFIALTLLACGGESPTQNEDANNDLKKTEQQVEEQPTLKQVLDAKKEAFEQKADDVKKRVYKEGIDSVRESGLIESAVNVGDTAPNFMLKNALGEEVELYDYLDQGTVILTWYRGGWCPYCNLTLHQLQLELSNFKANGAQLFALTPELPDQSMSTSEKHELEFEILSDIDNQVARKYGIVFKLTDEVAEMYNESFDLESYNGNNSNELPLAATYIIDQNGIVVYAFLDAEYRNRAEPSDLTAFLEKMN